MRSERPSRPLASAGYGDHMPALPTAVVDAATRVKTVFFVRVMSLPPGVQRRLAGRPIVIEGNQLATQAQLMLRLQRVAREPATETLPLAEGRVAMTRQAQIAGGHHPIGDVQERTVQGAAGKLPARLYVPRAAVRTGPGPLALFFHGGGMVRGDLDSHDAVCRFLAEEAGVRVLAVDYRLAPEHPFPAGLEDTLAALAWAQEHAASLGASPERIGIGGDSAGGNLAAVASAHAERPPAAQLLIYPATDAVSRRASEVLFGESYFLTSADRETFTRLYLEGSGVERADPRVSPLLATNLSGLPPALVVTAGFDLLRDEGEAYAEALRQSGVPVVLCRFPGLVHGFIHLTGLVTAAREAMTETSESWRSLCERTAGGST
jgi:acetyl esterase